MAVMGRPRLDPIRKKQVRYGTIEDTFKEVINSLKEKEDREKIEKALMKIKGNRRISK